jgi:RimJ/RimL family protein N-acetyltransferase
MNPDLSVSFESRRLILRAYQPGDGPMYLAVGQKNRAHLQRYESGNSILTARTDEESEQVITNLRMAWEKREAFFLGAFDRVSAEFVAQIYVGVVNWNLPEFEIGYFVDVDHEGQGYVSEAVRATLNWLFTNLDAHRVCLRCSDTNVRSALVAEHCGFQLEGHLRETRRDSDGNYSGDLYYGLLKNEFES